MKLSIKIVRQHKIFSLIALGLALVTAIFVPATILAGGNEKRVVQKQGWSYTLNIENGTISDVIINYDYSTAKGIAAYAAAQRQANEQLYKSGVRVVEAAQVVFRQPLTWDEADALVKQYGFVAYSYDLEVIEQGNTTENKMPPGIMGIGLIRNGKTLEGFDDQSRQAVQQQVQQLQQDDSAGTISTTGIVGMQISLDYPEYEGVSSDKKVYLVEMSRQIIKLELKNKADPQLSGIDTSKINLNDLNLDDLNVSYVAGPLYRHLQEVGIAPN